MEIAQTQTQPAASSGPATAAYGQSGVISSDFETFLRMLTTQMENQDPLNPIESADFAVQLATFSSVEQQVQTNDLLRDLTARIGSGEIGQLAGWVGMEARAAAPVYFSGTPIDLDLETAPGATSATLIARDESGRVVERLPIPVGGGRVNWDGQSETGAPFLEGLYTFEVESRAGEAVIETAPVQTYGTVEEARIEEGQVILVFGGGGTAPAASVTAIRNPDTG